MLDMEILFEFQIPILVNMLDILLLEFHLWLPLVHELSLITGLPILSLYELMPFFQILLEALIPLLDEVS